jgi:hypothetical protein
MASHKGTIIVPTENAHEEFVTLLQRRLANRFGGFSVYDGYGGWVDNHGNLITEEHVRIEVAGDNPERMRHVLDIERRRVKHETGDETVYTEVKPADIEIK